MEKEEGRESGREREEEGRGKRQGGTEMRTLKNTATCIWLKMWSYSESERVRISSKLLEESDLE